MVCWAIKFVTDQRQLPHTAILAAYWDNALPWLEQNYKMGLSYLEVRPSCRRYIYTITNPCDTASGHIRHHTTARHPKDQDGELPDTYGLQPGTRGGASQSLQRHPAQDRRLVPLFFRSTFTRMNDIRI